MAEPAQPFPAPEGIPDHLALPTGMVTFLFTDVEGSTQLLNAHPEHYRHAVRRHHDLLLEAVQRADGAVFETVGDAVYAAFARPTDAVKAALWGQLSLQAEDWGPTPIRIRMGIHLGEVELQHTGQGLHYFGAALYRCARLMTTAHGGQVVLSEAVTALVRDSLPEGASLRDLGEHHLKDIQRPERIYQFLHSKLPSVFPPLRTVDSWPNNLPLPVTSFVGRDAERAAVKQMLAQERERLVTLVGTAGTGKTRLALQVVGDLLTDYADGVWLVELASLTQGHAVPAAIATALGIRPESGVAVEETLADALRPKQLLLVLDNCEHLVEACATVCDLLLHACPRVQLLATSREALEIAGEHSYRVPPLTVPAADTAEDAVALDVLARVEAVRLFVERGRASSPSFALTEENAPAIVEICRRLDGLPLAIELAAARVKLLTPAQLLARLEDCFRVLSGGSRTALPRQRTLQATLDWSYNLLSPAEQTLFGRLSVFAGSFSLEAAEVVCSDDTDPRPQPQGSAASPVASARHQMPEATLACLPQVSAASPVVSAPTEPIAAADVLDLLSLLVDKSLVTIDDTAPGVTRYRLLETLRQYGRRALSETWPQEEDRWYRRHCAYFTTLATRYDGDLLDQLEHELDPRGTSRRDGAAVSPAQRTAQRAWLAQLATEYENLRAALHWTMEHGEVHNSARLAGALWLAIEYRLSRASPAGAHGGANSVASAT